MADGETCVAGLVDTAKALVGYVRGENPRVSAAIDKRPMDSRWSNQTRLYRRTEERLFPHVSYGDKKKGEKKSEGDIASLNCPKALFQGSNGAWGSRRRHLHTHRSTHIGGHTHMESRLIL